MEAGRKPSLEARLQVEILDSAQQCVEVRE